jgi:hypothetical protein
MSSALKASITHAELILYSGTGKKLGGQTGKLALDFNPKELSWTRSANWDGGKQTKKPDVPEYKGPAPGVVSFEAFLSYPSTPDVSKAVLSLFDCVAPDKATKDTNPRPPFVQLAWGGFRTGINVVKSVAAKLTLFDADGTPTRATVQLQLQEVPLDPPRQNPTSGGPPGRRIHVVIAGDTLDRTAFAEYGDAARWRDIAASNGIDDPNRVRPGTHLIIPLPDDLPARS